MRYLSLMIDSEAAPTGLEVIVIGLALITLVDNSWTHVDTFSHLNVNCSLIRTGTRCFQEGRPGRSCAACVRPRFRPLRPLWITSARP